MLNNEAEKIERLVRAFQHNRSLSYYNALCDLALASKDENHKISPLSKTILNSYDIFRLNTIDKTLKDFANANISYNNDYLLITINNKINHLVKSHAINYAKF
jgi:hypothetical protein